MKNINYKIIINIALILWIFIWIYYMAFNWGIFSVELKINLGFTTINGYPFLFFALTGLLILIILKYAYHLVAIYHKNKEKEAQNRKTMLEKDIEILQLKEVLFKMQTKDLSESSSAFSALQEKLDNIAQKIPDSTPNETSADNEKPADSKEGKKDE